VPQRLFRGLLPKESRPALLRYERAAAACVTRTESEVKEQHANVRRQLAEAGLPGAVEHYASDQGEPRLPDSLWARVQRANQMTPQLRTGSDAVRTYAATQQGAANRINAAIAAEEAADLEFRSTRVTAAEPWTGVSSAALLAEYKKDCQHYAQLLAQARASDAQLLRQIGDGAFQAKLGLLASTRGDLESRLPRAQPLAAHETHSGFIEPRPRYDTTALQGKLVALAQALSEREKTLQALKASTGSEGLRQQLSKTATDLGFGKPGQSSLSEEPFEVIADAEVRRLEAAQKQLLDALGMEAPLLAQTLQENARFQQARDVDPVNLERARVFRDVEAAVVAATTLVDQLGEGARFYETLGGRFERLETLVNDAASAQGLARADYAQVGSVAAQRAKQEDADAALARQLADQEEKLAAEAPEEKADDAIPADAEGPTPNGGGSAMNPKNW